MIDPFLILAQASGDAPPTGTPAEGARDPFLSFFVPLILAMVVFYFILFRGQRKERQKQQQMLSALKRNDRVLTIGGIIGTVIDVRDNEVVLKVDETNNVKMRFLRSAVKEVLAAKPDQPAQS